MTTGGLPTLQALARGVADAARAVLRRGQLAAAVWVTAATGGGFLVFAAYAAMRPGLGPALSALLTGVALIGLAALAAEAGGQLPRLRQPGPRPGPHPEPRADPSAVRPQPTAEAATVAVFTAAYVLGRRLADRGRD